MAETLKSPCANQPSPELQLMVPGESKLLPDPTQPHLGAPHPAGLIKLHGKLNLSHPSSFTPCWEQYSLISCHAGSTARDTCKAWPLIPGLSAQHWFSAKTRTSLHPAPSFPPFPPGSHKAHCPRQPVPSQRQSQSLNSMKKSYLRTKSDPVWNRNWIPLQAQQTGQQNIWKMLVLPYHKPKTILYTSLNEGNKL